MKNLVSGLTVWMNKYADSMAASGEDLLHDFAFAFNSVEGDEQEDVQDPMQVTFEFDLEQWSKLLNRDLIEEQSEKHMLGAASPGSLLDDIRTPADWDALSVEDWDQILGLPETTQEEVIEHEMGRINVDDPFAAFIASLSEDELMEIREHEWREILGGREPSEVKAILDQFDHKMLLHIARVYTKDEIWDFLEGLSDDDWENTTPDEW